MEDNRCLGVGLLGGRELVSESGRGPELYTIRKFLAELCTMLAGTLLQRWEDRYFGPLVRCPADYRNVSGPADWKK
jgi:hypothetical protein